MNHTDNTNALFTFSEVLAVPLVPPAKFRLGKLLITPGAQAAITESKQSPWDFIVRHMACDFGNVCDEDKRLNLEAVTTGERILSTYKTTLGADIWVLTEADRSATVCLLASEY